MEPGSWAEWVGSIATALTFGGGAFLWRKDVADKKRSLASRFRVVPRLIQVVDNSVVTFEVTAHNAGDSPIYSASIAFFNKNDQYCFEAISPVSFPTVDMMLAPGESKFTAIPEPINPNTYDPIISFYDGNGQKWNRRLSDGSYRSHRWLEAWRTKQRQKTWLEAKLFDVRMELLRQKVAADRRARNNGTSP